MPTVQSVTRGTADLAGTLGVDRLVRSFADEIFLIEANAMPLTALARGINKITVPAIKREWLEDEKFPETVTVDTVVTTTESALVLDTPGGDFLAEDDLLLNTASASGEIMRVEAVASATALTVEKGFGATTAATVADGVTLLRIGNAMQQGSNTPAFKTTVEVLRSNGLQRFRKAFSITKEMSNTKLYGESQLFYQKRKTLMELLREVEYTNFFGTFNAGSGVVEVSAATTNDPTSAAGLEEYITANAPTALRVDNAAALVSEAILHNLIKASYLNKGPHEPGEKILFASPSAISDIEQLATLDLRTIPSDTIHGVKVRKWQTSFGDISIVNHPLLGVGGANENWMFLLDIQDISQVVQTNMDLEYVERNMENVDGQEIIVGEWKISQCLQVKGSGGVHGYIQNILD